MDDGHIPVEDAKGVETVGRHKGEGMWGRWDDLIDGREDPGERGWVAFTTDPGRRDLGWVVRWHPAHGRSVVLYRNGDASTMHAIFTHTVPAFVFRAGGYWWDGADWYRPAQVWDSASEKYVRRVAPAATTVTAADLLVAHGDPDSGRILTVDEIDPASPYRGSWRSDLALWAAVRDGDESQTFSPRDLSRNVVTVTAPELAADQLVSVAGLAKVGEVAASTLRAYLSRGEGDIPRPQAVVNGHNMWSRPVAEDWAEQRRRAPDSVKAAVSDEKSPQPVGVIDVWNRFTQRFFSMLWQHPDRRKRWALRWRNEAAVRNVAEELGWQVAADLTGYSDGLVPVGALTDTITMAVLYDLHRGQRLHQRVRQDTSTPKESSERDEYGIGIPVTTMLDWLIRHDPRAAGRAIGEITGEAEREFAIPRPVTERSLRRALHLDGKLSGDLLDDFLSKVMSPATST